MPEPLFEQLSILAQETPIDSAILASDSPSLNYKNLFELVQTTNSTLRRRGLRYQDRIAVVLPPGPEMAVAVIAIAALAVCVPLNPGLADHDWHKLFKDLRIRALLTIPTTNGMAEDAAHELNLQIVELFPLPNSGAGMFELAERTDIRKVENQLPQLKNDAFVLPTSGTTSRPKMVPLTHLNLCHSGINTARALRLSDDDRLLSVLPLYHAHGLISGLISSIAAGSSVVCMRCFTAQSFFDHLSVFQPTWYTAVPAYHQAIISGIPPHQDVLERHSLRLIRSASAPLPSEQLLELERLFGVPVIETYGMTEACSQIASNPLPPGNRKLGSVGTAAGPEIIILDEEGKQCLPGVLGEIALRGPNLSRGYDDPSSIGASSATRQWFRTGDIGYLDVEGYLYIRGRTKDIINRGGEKIVPRKIDEVFLEHPEVFEAAAFSLPHPRLGEDVAVAIVLQPHACVTVRSLRSFALNSNRLRHSEVPRHIIVVEEIPKSSAGKIQRQNIAKSLGYVKSGASGIRQPSKSHIAETEIEQRLCQIWSDIFGLEHVGLEDDFFLLGGDSLLAIQMAIQISEIYSVNLSLRTLFEAPTVSELAEQIVKSRSSIDEGFSLKTIGLESTVERVASLAQEGILETESQFKGAPIFNLPFAFRLTGEFHPDAFQRGLKFLISRNEIFRTVFKKRQDHWKTIPSNSINTKIPVENWKVVPKTKRVDFTETILAEEAWTAFDLAEEPPFRLRVMKFADDDHVLIFSIHHVIMDRWTIGILLEELFGHYATVLQGDSPKLAKPEFQFSDFARWQRLWCEGKEAKLQLAFWKDKLGNAASVFAGDPGLSRTNPGFGTASIPVTLSSELISNVMELSQMENSTAFITMLAGLKVLLLSKFGRNDICVATPMANRSRPNTQDVMGLIENTVVVRTFINESMSFRDVLISVREVVLNAHARQELPFEVLLKEIREEERLETNPLTDIYFSIVNHIKINHGIENLTVERIEPCTQAQQQLLPFNSAKLMFMLKETRSCIAGACIYKESDFNSDFVQDLISSYERLLLRAVSMPDLTLTSLLK